MSGIVYLDPATVSIRLTEGASTPEVLIDGRAAVERAQIRRLFPLSQSWRFLSIADPDGKEVGVLPSLDGMDAESVETVERLLDRKYFTPVVRHIRKLTQEGGMWRFEVETQRGTVEFFVRNWRDSAHEIGAGRWLVSSVDGQRFEIPGEGTLDSRSQILLEQLL